MAILKRRMTCSGDCHPKQGARRHHTGRGNTSRGGRGKSTQPPVEKQPHPGVRGHQKNLICSEEEGNMSREGNDRLRVFHKIRKPREVKQSEGTFPGGREGRLFRQTTEGEGGNRRLGR